MNRQLASQVAGFAAVVIAAAVLIGLWADLPLLSSWGAGLPATRPLGALCLAGLGLALMRTPGDRRWAVAAGLAVTAVAAIDLGLALLGAGPDIGLPAAAPLLVQGLRLLAMPTASALGLVLVGGAFVLSRFEQHYLASIVLASITGGIAAFALLGYLTGINALYSVTSIGSPPLPTVVALLCVAFGIILRIGAEPALHRARPLWHLLAALGWAIVAPLLLFGAYASGRIADAQLDQVRGELMNEVRALSADVDWEVVGEIETLEALAASPSLQHGDFAAFQRQAEASLASRRSGIIVLTDRDMRQVVHTAVPFGTPMPKAPIPGPVERVFATGKPQVTGLFYGPVANKRLFAILIPVKIDGEIRYTLGRTPSRLVLSRVASSQLPAGRNAVVFDAAHHILAQSGQDIATVFGKELPRSQWPRPGTGAVQEFTDSEGQPSLQLYTQSELTGWGAAIWAPKAVLGAPLEALWRTLGWMALLAFALVVALALWVGQIIARSVGHAARAAAALGEGRTLPPSGTPVAEVNALMAELRRAATRRQAAEDLLRDSEARFRAMFEVSSVGKIEIESETGRFLHANAAMCELVGYSEAELLATTVWDITHPDERDRDRALSRRLLAGEVPVFDVEKRYIRKDGTAVWVRVTTNVMRDESSRPLRTMAVVQDVTARKQAQQELQASKDRLQLAFDATRLGWWHYDPLRGVISGDARANEICDAPNEGWTRDVFEEKRVHPDDVRRLHAAFEAAIDPAGPKPLAIEYRVRRGSGTVRWVENHGLAHFEGAGRERRLAGYVGTIQDVTERKEHEEKEHLLMREMSHRAKNTLSVVDAIAHQAAARNPEDFVARFSERIHALSASQDLLVRNDWKGVEAKDLVHAQLAHFADLIGSRITTDGPKLRLNEDCAQAIGLALHELATNAGKYGALSTDTGRVDICWAAGRGTFTMRWTESGGPAVSAPKRRGFGSIVVKAMAERSVDGKVDLDYAPSGVTWRLTCPAANALERPNEQVLPERISA